MKSKLPKFYEGLKELLDDKNAIVLTNKEIWVAVNYKLAPEDKVSYRTFEQWLSPSSPVHYTKHTRALTEEERIDMGELLDYSKVKQKLALADEMLDGKKTNKWGASWIMERKFPDMKLQKGNEAKDKGTTINIIASNSDHKALIDDIISGGTEDIDHEDLSDQQLLD